MANLMTLLWTGFLFIGSVNAELIRGDSPSDNNECCHCLPNPPDLTAGCVPMPDCIEYVCTDDGTYNETGCCTEWGPSCDAIADEYCTAYSPLMEPEMSGELTELEVAQNSDAELVRGDNGAEDNECCQCLVDVNLDAECTVLTTCIQYVCNDDGTYYETGCCTEWGPDCDEIAEVYCIADSPLMARDVDSNDPIRTDELVANIDEDTEECPCDMDCCPELTWNWEPRCAQIATDYGCLMVQGLEGELAEFVVVPEEGRNDVIGRFVSNSGWLLPCVVIGNVLLCVGAASIIRKRKDIEYEAITDMKSTTSFVSE